MGRWGLVFVVACLTFSIAVKTWRKHQFHLQLRMDRISVDSLAQMLASGEAPVVVDVRSAHAQASGRIPGAVAFSEDAWPEDLRSAVEHAVVIVYCDCPNEASAALVARKLMQRGFTRVRPLAGGIEAWRDAGLALE